jgi:hypothetical protein
MPQPPILSKPSKAAHKAIAYVTVGALIVVWAGVWLWYRTVNNLPQDAWHYVCFGLLFSGAVLLIIGFTLGSIGRAARHAELPPEAPPDKKTAQPAVAQPIVVPPAGAVPGAAAPPGVVVQRPVAPTAPAAPGAPTAPVR